MKRSNLTIFLWIAFGLIDLYSQERDPLSKVSVSDFSVQGDRSVCLWYRSVFSYPYSPCGYCVGAQDRFFSLKNETFMRILLNRNDTSFRFLAIHKFYKSVPEITSVKCYFPGNMKINSGSTKKTSSVLIVNYFDKGCFLDLSALKDSSRNVIVDLKYTYPVFSKKEFSSYIDSKLDYKFLYVRIDVPEIYTYDIDFDSTLLSERVNKPTLGPVIGYGPTAYYKKNKPRRPGEPLIIVSYENMKYLVGQRFYINGKLLPATFDYIPEYFCKIHPYIFRSKKPMAYEIESKEDSFPVIIKFDLRKIKEIYSWLDGPPPGK